MKKLKEHRNAIRVILILSATGLMGLSNPYGHQSRYNRGVNVQELAYALNEPAGPLRLETNLHEWYWTNGRFSWFKQNSADLMDSGLIVLALLNCNSEASISFVETFLPDTICDPRHPHGYNDSLNTLYRKAFYEYFAFPSWPYLYDYQNPSSDTLWKKFLRDFCSEFEDRDFKYFEIENELNCCHRSQMLRWLAFGFGCDSTMRANYPAETLNYLVRTVDVFGTKVRVHILPDNLIYTINPFWQGGTTEDMKILSGGKPASDSLRDTLCVYMVYLADSFNYRRDTFYMVIPYDLKIYIVDSLWTGKWFIEHMMRPAYDSLHAHFPGATVMGPSIALENNFHDISLKYLNSHAICHDNLSLKEAMQ